jgi:hypothetical protein
MLENILIEGETFCFYIIWFTDEFYGEEKCLKLIIGANLHVKFKTE